MLIEVFLHLRHLSSNIRRACGQKILDRYMFLPDSQDCE